MPFFKPLILALTLAALPLGGCAAALDRAQARTQTVAVPAIEILTPAEVEVLRATNAFRAEHGLSELAPDAQLVEVARARSHDMAKRTYFAHLGPDGSDVFKLLRLRKVPYWAAGENLARNNHPVVEAASVAMRGWKKSPGHKANLLHPSFGRLGVGVARDAKGVTYITQVFAD